MTQADKHFIETCKRIIKEGYSSVGTGVRTRWADEDGSIGKAYGYQMAKKYEFKTKEGIKEMDQVDYALYL